MKPYFCWTSVLLAPLTFAAQSANSVPVGGLTVTIGAGTVGVPTSKSFTIPLYDPPLAVGAGVARITSIAWDSNANTSTLTVTGAGWTAGALATAAFPYAFRLTSGAVVGATFYVTANTTDTMTTSGVDLTTLGIVTGASGDSFRLIPVDTLNTLFGSTTLLGGANSTAADLVVLSSNSQLAYYYDTTFGQWRRQGLPLDFGNTRIPLDSAITIVRKSSELILRFTGRVPDVRFRLSVPNSGSTYTHTGFPTDVTLGALSLQTALPGWVTGASATADILVVGLESNALAYYHNGSNWTRASVPLNFDPTIIPAGTPIQIFRRGSASGTTPLTRNLPYSL